MRLSQATHGVVRRIIRGVVGQGVCHVRGRQPLQENVGVEIPDVGYFAKIFMGFMRIK